MSNATRAYASVYVDGKVFLAKVLPTVVFPSAALVPLFTLADSITNPALEFQALKLPDSKPSEKTGDGGGADVTETTGVSAETLPAMSRALTAYWCVDEPSTESV